MEIQQRLKMLRSVNGQADMVFTEVRLMGTKRDSGLVVFGGFGKTIARRT